MTNIIARSLSETRLATLVDQGLHPVLARIYAARGIESAAQLETDLSGMIPYQNLQNATEMAHILADAIRDQKRILIVADYDADGATACAVGIRALRDFGACVDYLVPNRFEYGYGLTPEIVRHAHEFKRPDFIITVDNGIASVEGVALANTLGISVLVTDHHLPGQELPDAACIVDPSQSGCIFPSKNLAGVGVIFYVMIALRAELRNRGQLAASASSDWNLARLLDLVALGTVADVVKLDRNNRILVQQGLKRMRAGAACPGVQALFRVAGRETQRASSYDLGFVIGPRLNAAGRLDNMSLGVECLISDDAQAAFAIAKQLDELNNKRREIQTEMQDSVLATLDDVDAGDKYSMCLFDAAWHPGVVGILAARLKDRFHRPAIVFAPGSDGEIKGSGRSISGLHLRDALDLVSKKYPQLILRFGGHAAAAGVSLRHQHFNEFAQAFEEIVQSLLTPADLDRVIETDGSLASQDLTLDLARLLQQNVWGQGFPQPQFFDEFTVERQRVVGGKHLKLSLNRSGQRFDAILFSHPNSLPQTIRAVYRIEVNEYQHVTALQLNLQHWQRD